VNFGIKQRGVISKCPVHCANPISGLLGTKTTQARRKKAQRWGGAASDTTNWNAIGTANGTTQYLGDLLEEKHEVTVTLR